MTLDQAMAELEKLGSEKTRQMNAKNGVGDNQYGVAMGDLRTLAKQIKTNHELGLALWATGNWDTMLLATLLFKPKLFSAEEVDAMVRAIPYDPKAMHSQLGDWVMTNIVRPHPDKEALRQRWMDTDAIATRRAGWSLTADRVCKDREGLDASALLDRIEKEMGSSPVPVQWTMNFALGYIGIEYPEHRERVLAMGEKLGAFRDYPTSKGCTSPFVPIWVREMVGRQSGS